MASVTEPLGEPTDAVGARVEKAEPRQLLDIVAVAAMAALVRGLHLLQIREHDPFFAMPSVDGAVYHAWALEIAAGDWAGWAGESVFSLAPLYPYVLAALYSAVGPSFLAAKALQLALGAAACAALVPIGRNLFDRRVGLLAGFGLAIYPMALLYEGTHLIAALQAPLAVAVLGASIWAARCPTAARGFALGAVIGLAALARPNALLFAPLLAAGWLFSSRGPQDSVARRRAAAAAVALCVGVGFALAPTAVRNRVVGGEWFAVSASGGLNLYVGNHAAADGTFSAFPADFDARFFDSPKEQHGTGRRVAEQRAGRALSAQEVSSYWSGRAFDVIADNPLRWLRLEARKLLLFVNASEVWNNRSIELSRDFSWVLRLPLPGFGVVAPLGLLGMLLCRARVRELWPLYAAIAVQGLTALLFFVLARYRYPVVPALLLFAAAAGCELWDRARARRARPLATAAAGLTSLAILVHLPLVENPLHMAHFNLANRYRAVERWELAADHYWRSVTLAQAYLPAFEQLALTYEDWGKRDEAVRIWQHLRDLATARNADTRAARAEQHLRSLGAPLRDAPTLPGANGLRRDSEPTP